MARHSLGWSQLFMKTTASFFLMSATLLCSALSGSSAEFFVSTAGKASATGSITDPLALVTAITSGTSPVHTGDTLWVRGGVYTAPIPGFVFSLNGDVNRPVIFRNYNKERAIIDGTFKAHGKFVYYWGLEFTDKTTPYLPTSLTRSQKEAQMLNGSYSACAYYLEAAPSSRFINNYFHDSYGQIEYGNSSSNSVFYGNVVLNLGEQCLDTERGVGIYAQNRDGTREITDNIVAQNILNGVDVWSSGNAYINNFTVEGNICFNNGYGKIQGGRNMLSGAGNGCTNLLMVSNILYNPFDSFNRANLIVGHGGQSYAPKIYDNLSINGGYELTESFGGMEFTGNELLSTATWNNFYVAWPRDLKPTSYIFSNNKFYGQPLMEVNVWVTNSSNPTGGYIRTQTPSGWPGWQQLGANYVTVGSSFRPDANSLYTSSRPSGTRVIVRPNRYELGRANIAILNFDLKSTVDVDLSVLGLPPNTTYELHPVQNLFNQTNTGTYTGGPITVPMTGWGIRQPPSRAKDLTSTFPQFGAFLFIARGTTGNTAPIISTIPDQSIKQGGTTGTINFTVSDLESPASLLILTATSDNTTLVPLQNITFGGTGSARTLNITPPTLQSGTARITVTANDGFAKAIQTFNLTVTPVNQPPIIASTIPAQTIPMNGSSSTLSVLVGDPDTAATDLILSATSSNPALIPAGGLTLGGSGFSRTLKITPTTGVSGSAVVTIQISDGFLSTNATFSVTVTTTGTAKPPTISDIPDQRTLDGSAILNIPFTVSDPDTAATSLVTTGSSSDTSLIPTAGIVIIGSGASRTVNVTPAPVKSGTATVTLQVSDGANHALESFLVAVRAGANTPPTLTSLPDATLLPETTSAGPYNFTVGDLQTAPASLVVGGWSTKRTLVKDSQMVFGGSGANRTVTVTPEAGQSGTTLLLLWVSDGQYSTTNTFRLTVYPANSAPTLTGLPTTGLSVAEDSTNGQNIIYFSVSDVETPANNLQVSATCTDTNLVPLQNVELGGTGTDRYLKLTPAPNANGSATVFVTASDGTKITSVSFLLTVTPVVDGPVLGDLGNLSIDKNTVNQPVHFTVGDPDLSAPSLASLIVQAWSGDETLVPNSNLSLAGTGSDRTLTLTPATDIIGTNSIFISVSDGSLTTTQSFRLTVLQPNQAPIVDAGTNTAVYSSLNYMLRGKVTDDGLPLSPGRTSMRWSTVSGPGVVSFSTPTFGICTARFSTLGFYRLRLTATDGALTNSDDIYILVKPTPDTTPPLISGLQIGEVTPDSLTVTWNTDELSNSQLEYGANGVLESVTALDPMLERNHSVTVSHLDSDTLYVLRAKTRDGSANLATSSSLTIRTLRRTFAYIPLTADAASLDAPMTWGIGSAPDGDPYIGTVTETQGTASWDFYAPIPGTYYLWGRVYAPSSRRDSFFLNIDNGTNDVYDAAEGTWSPSWQWTRINGRNGSAPLTLDPRTFHLNAGLHTLVVGGREAQSLLNRVLITNDPDYTPSDDRALAGINSPALLVDPIYRLTVPAGWSMIGNPLQTSNRRFSALLPSSLNTAEYDRYNPTSGDFSSTVFSGGTWSDPELTFGQGEGGLFYNPSGAPMTLVLTGQVVPNPAQINLYPGINLLSLNTPIAGKLSTLINNFHFVANDKVQVIDAETQAYHTYTYSGEDWDVIPVLNLGEAVFLNLAPR